MLAYVDGQVMDLAQASIPLDDRGFLLGDGVFETMRTVDGHVFEGALHEARLLDGLRRLGLDADPQPYRDAVAALVEAARQRIGERMGLRIQVSTGAMTDLVTPGALRYTGIARPLPEHAPEQVRVATMPGRIRRDDPLAGIKTLSFLPYVTARRQALAAGADDALLGNDAGRWVEGATANLFVRVGDTVYAPGPAQGTVDGVTRRVLLRHCDAIEAAPPEGPWDEAWFTSSIAGVVPISHIDGSALAGRSEAKRLRDVYRSLV